MRALPFLMTSLLGWIVAYLITALDRHPSAMSGWMRMANYPIGIAGASVGTWVSQTTPSLYNKLFVIGIFFSGIAVVLYQAIRRFLLTRRKSQPH